LGILAAVAIPKYISMMDESRISGRARAVAEVKSRCSVIMPTSFCRVFHQVVQMF